MEPIKHSALTIIMEPIKRNNKAGGTTMVTSINAFRDMMRVGKYKDGHYMIQKLTTSAFIADRSQGAYLLNKPLTDTADRIDYKQQPLADGCFIVFVGTSWTTALVNDFMDAYGKRLITRAGGRYKTGLIPSWRKHAVAWLDDMQLAHTIVAKKPASTIVEALPITGMNVERTAVDGNISGVSVDGRIGYSHASYRAIRRGWCVILIRFVDEEQMDQYINRICVAGKCWIFDKNDLTILYACFYENTYLSAKIALKDRLRRMSDHEALINTCLWMNEEETCHQYYDQYTGYMSRETSTRYREWFKDDGTDGGKPENGTFKFLKNLVCVKVDQGPISVGQAMALLEVSDEQTSD